MKEKVRIVIPIYQDQLSITEQASLRQCYDILSKYPIIFVQPQSIDISRLMKQFPKIETRIFADDYFTGIEGYNRLMLSSEFYEVFLDTEFILIYQLDAYVFRDELEDWCDKNYDFIGAPWIHKPKRTLSNWFGWKQAIEYLENVSVGNGGFSLRKVSSCWEIALKEAEMIRERLSQPYENSAFEPEDIFWAIEPRKKGYRFRIPDYKEALLFSFDKHPAYCFHLSGKIPFGCHAWNRKKMFRFWKNYIQV